MIVLELTYESAVAARNDIPGRMKAFEEARTSQQLKIAALTRHRQQHG